MLGRCIPYPATPGKALEALKGMGSQIQPDD